MSRRFGTVVPHEVPLSRFRTVTDVKHQLMVMREPREAEKRAGMLAFDAGKSRDTNPWPVLSPEYAAWDSGWALECEANS